MATSCRTALGAKENWIGRMLEGGRSRAAVIATLLLSVVRLGATTEVSVSEVDLDDCQGIQKGYLHLQMTASTADGGNSTYQRVHSVRNVVDLHICSAPQISSREVVIPRACNEENPVSVGVKTGPGEEDFNELKVTKKEDFSKGVVLLTVETAFSGTGFSLKEDPCPQNERIYQSVGFFNAYDGQGTPPSARHMFMQIVPPIQCRDSLGGVDIPEFGVCAVPNANVRIASDWDSGSALYFKCQSGDEDYLVGVAYQQSEATSRCSKPNIYASIPPVGACPASIDIPGMEDPGFFEGV